MCEYKNNNALDERNKLYLIVPFYLDYNLNSKELVSSIKKETKSYLNYSRQMRKDEKIKKFDKLIFAYNLKICDENINEDKTQEDIDRKLEIIEECVSKEYGLSRRGKEIFQISKNTYIGYLYMETSMNELV